MRDEPTATYVREAVDYRPVLMAGALRMTRNPADAEDLVQETYLRAHQSCDSFEGNHLRAWLNRILSNAYHWRRRRPEVLGLDSRSDDPAGVAVGGDPADEVLAALPDEALKDALTSLSAITLRVVVLADVEGYSYQEIAAAERIPAALVRYAPMLRGPRSCTCAGMSSKTASLANRPAAAAPSPLRSAAFRLFDTLRIPRAAVSPERDSLKSLGNWSAGRPDLVRLSVPKWRPSQ